MTGINRRDFLKLGLLSASALAFIPKSSMHYSMSNAIADFPKGTRLGRVFKLAEVKSKPDLNSSTVGTLYQDNVVEWQRDVIGVPTTLYPTNSKWVETPTGYIPATYMQPVQAILNTPLTALPQQTESKGFWAEVTVPYVDITLDNPPARAPLLKDWITNSQPPRFYYSQIFWVDDIKTDDQGNTLYHVIEKHASYGDTFWADARAFRQITADELTPINPDVTDKKIIVDLTHQTLSCYEGKREVFFTRVSSGAKFTSEGVSTESYATPTGQYYAITTKYISVHMSGGSAASGYELFGVSWTSIFATGGVAMHSTFWHNNFGEPMSHGCINMTPEDSKFIYRWSLPQAPYEAGTISQTGYSGTNVQVFKYSI